MVLSVLMVAVALACCGLIFLAASGSGFFVSSLVLAALLPLIAVEISSGLAGRPAAGPVAWIAYALTALALARVYRLEAGPAAARTRHGEGVPYLARERGGVERELLAAAMFLALAGISGWKFLRCGRGDTIVFADVAVDCYLAMFLCAILAILWVTFTIRSVVAAGKR